MKSNLRKIATALCAAGLCLAWAVDSVRAATFYVATAGKDSNPGTLAQPFLTIQKGAGMATSPGDTVYVRGGTYTNNTRIFLRSSGTAGKPITLSNYPGESPVIRFVNRSSGLYPRVEIVNPASANTAIGWLVIRGFEITGGYDGIKYYNAHDLTIERNDIHDSLWQGILGIGGLRVAIIGNTIRHNGDLGGSQNDRSLKWKLHGIYATGTRYTITNNIFNANLAWGIQVAGYPYDGALHTGPEYAGASDWLIANNTFAFEANRGGIVVWLPGASNITIKNNIFYQNSRLLAASEGQGIDFYHCGGGNIVRNNIFYATAPGGTVPITDTSKGASYTQAGNKFDTDPLFKDPGSNDFHLRAGSPAIAVGPPGKSHAIGALEDGP